GENLDIGWLTHEHTGVPVIIYAFGPNAVRFTGVHDKISFRLIIRIYNPETGLKQKTSFT
ncbi:MAG: alkaline phosphatase, partial [Bacteroidetes bacterium]|nr:alkaline phosphatase [Bacteroidota bacterium]